MTDSSGLAAAIVSATKVELEAELEGLTQEHRSKLKAALEAVDAKDMKQGGGKLEVENLEAVDGKLVLDAKAKETLVLDFTNGWRQQLQNFTETIDDPRAVAEVAYRCLIEALGKTEASRPELVKTPARAAKAWLERTSGIQVIDPLSAVGEGIFEVEGAQDLVAVRDISFNSTCEHHLLPFWGTVHVAYIPNGRVLGLSKFARLLKVLSQRLQLQERLTKQFVEAIFELLAPQGVAVAIEARHSCMSMRGVATPAVTRTIALRGATHDPFVQMLLMNGIGGAISSAPSCP